ncbi:MAG: hypothetical protein LBS49_12060 [Candidatus Accumulibacter sp.]|nr:hypothetical protein [Accumulibacter sp.]
MKVTQDNGASRYFATGLPGTLSSRSGYAETEPVHTIVADRDAEAHGDWAAEPK